MHGAYAAVSVFANIPDAEASRNASFYAIVALTPRDGSRLGKVWLHASRLKSLSTSLRDHISHTEQQSADRTNPNLHTLFDNEAEKQLETYWNQFSVGSSNHQDEDGDEVQKRAQRRRGLSESLPHSNVPNMHPANSMFSLIETLGPLIYPIYRHALLRKRILLISKPPLHRLCDYVYLLSILSSIPAILTEMLPHLLEKSDPLFSVGIFDIDALNSRSSAGGGESSETPRAGYIACSSDELLATKPHLFDIQVNFPAAPDQNSEPRWPEVTTNEGMPIKATQRDIQHYKALRSRMQTLYELNTTSDEAVDAEEDAEEDAADEADHLLSSDMGTGSEEAWSVENEGAISEQLPWAAIAYDSFIWWASAGERDADFQEERDFDQDLLNTAFTERPGSAPRRRSSMSMSMSSRNEAAGSFEMGVVAYFHRLTASVLERLAEIIPPSSDDSSDDDPDEENFVTKSDLIKMGLDVWSKTDRAFVSKLARTYFGADLEVRASIECCGVKLL